ncbi:type II toxin-antitoxin system RelE/ParE family toxin [Desulfoprunum benzoelyticum]|uniref:Uncharacterized protein n=1 Tax=Desulfoprunum benzoelyticum TaxID=1506996 RepID=A0A840UQ94_9BACT|nr:type II toxin-antitoxin system RelE/ParE family toxin [Desulfoprunum benzoelyticum]MBB5346763.1 hypothetical protein [Desulfoprunum benzoelyticum]MBM9531544.1 type II toxin-antitoxin system RelE/ParE family toxin [Desulfoprunum benzoelyticum]
MTKRFSKWAADQGVSIGDLANTLEEVEQGAFEASLGSKIIKKRKIKPLIKRTRCSQGVRQNTVCLFCGRHSKIYRNRSID